MNTGFSVRGQRVPVDLVRIGRVGYMRPMAEIEPMRPMSRIDPTVK